MAGSTFHNVVGHVARGIYGIVDLFTHGFYHVYDRVAEQRRDSPDVYTPPEGTKLKNAILIPGTGLFDFSARFKETLFRKGHITATTCELPERKAWKYFTGYPTVLASTFRYFIQYDSNTPIDRVYGHSAGGISAAIFAGLAKASPDSRQSIAQGIHTFIGAPEDVNVSQIVALGERFERERTKFISIAAPFFALNFRANLKWLVHVATDLARGGLYSIFDRDSHHNGQYSIKTFHDLIGKEVKEVMDGNVIAVSSSRRQVEGSWASRVINIGFGETLKFFGWAGTVRESGVRTDGLVPESSATLHLSDGREAVLDDHDHAYVIETVAGAQAVLGFEAVFDRAA